MKRFFFVPALCAVFAFIAAFSSEPEGDLKQQAERMQRAAEGALAPVYAPTADWLVAQFSLAEKDGVAIDLGSGPGTLIAKLCERTRLHWINADINPHHFPYFFTLIDRRGFSERVSAIKADAADLPFKENFAEFIVSRGSFPFWNDQKAGFAEVLRVLKPGARAVIGRGLSPNMPVEIARAVRDKQNGGPEYDLQETRNKILNILAEIGASRIVFHRDKPAGAEDINYGIWVEFTKAN